MSIVGKYVRRFPSVSLLVKYDKVGLILTAMSIGNIFGAVTSVVGNLYNNQQGRIREREAREQNYMFNELAAKNADTRTRALYNDIYSPQALMQQYKAAGLSPSLMFGGTPGQGGMSGAQGAGVNQPSTFMPLSMLEAAQVGLTLAETQKTNAETNKVKSETTGQDLQNEFDSWRNISREAEVQISTAWIIDPESGESESLFDVAKRSNSYKEFYDIVKKACQESDNKKLATYVDTEVGNSVLRQIYQANYKFERDIEILSTESVDAQFKRSMLNCLSSVNFQKLNAQAAVSKLRAEVQTSELTEQQKKSWNHLIDKLPEGSTKDIVVVLGMILSQGMNRVSASASYKLN